MKQSQDLLHNVGVINLYRIGLKQSQDLLRDVGVVHLGKQKIRESLDYPRISEFEKLDVATHCLFDAIEIALTIFEQLCEIYVEYPLESVSLYQSQRLHQLAPNLWL